MVDRKQDESFQAYMAGSSAALEDSKEQIRRMDLWRAGEGPKCTEVTTALFRGLSEMPVWLEVDFREGYQERWAREVSLFVDRMFD